MTDHQYTYPVVIELRRVHQTFEAGRIRRDSPGAHEAAVTQLTAVIDELLEAQSDTVCLGSHHAEDDPAWAAHVDYLQALGRVGRRTLAELAAAGA
jgi:hypothetical protein